MNENQFRNLIAFCVLMESGEGIRDKSPDYVMEKFERYVGKESSEWQWGLDFLNQNKLAQYLKDWDKNIKMKYENQRTKTNNQNNL